jgi:uncharacterized protein
MARKPTQTFASLALFLLVGCQTGPSTAKRDGTILSRHDFAPSKISTTAEPGLVPTGVWRIKGPRNTLYLAGTSHLITEEQVPFPSTFYAAYNDSSELYLEVDDNGSFFSRLRLLRKMFKWMKSNRDDFVAPNGQFLSDVLSPDTVEKLRMAYGKKYSRIEKQTPLFVAFMGQMQAFSDQYMTDGGVEDVFAARARNDRKKIRALDDTSVDELVVQVLDAMVNELRQEIQESGPDAVIEEKVLREPEKIVETAWRGGDLAAIEAEMAEMQEETPALYEQIGPDRNRKWLAKLGSALQRDHNILALVGCAHLPGEQGLLNLLKQEGYQVEQLYGLDHMASAK